MLCYTPASILLPHKPQKHQPTSQEGHAAFCCHVRATACVCVCLYVCVYLLAWACVCVCAYVCVSACGCLYVCTYVCVSVVVHHCVRVHLRVCGVSAYACLRVHVSVCVRAYEVTRTTLACGGREQRCPSAAQRYSQQPS